jgi:hypothetical protein
MIAEVDPGVQMVALGKQSTKISRFHTTGV